MKKVITFLLVFVVGLTFFSLLTVAGNQGEGWAWPVPSNRTVFSGFDRVDLGVTRVHNGIDISEAADLQVIATRSGTVVTATNNCRALNQSASNARQRVNCCGHVWGNHVIIDHGNGYRSIYAHLRFNSVTVTVGDEVPQGFVIGITGSSGQSQGRHLHFEIRRNGVHINSNPANADIVAHRNNLRRDARTADLRVMKRGMYPIYYVTVAPITEIGIVYHVTPRNGDDSPISSSPVAAHHIGVRLSRDTVIFVTGYAVNQYGNLWYSFNHNGAVRWIYSGNVQAGRPIERIPSAPTGFNGVRRNATTATLSWNAVAGATSYEVQFWSRDRDEWRTDPDFRTSTATSYVTTGLDRWNYYDFRVRARNSAGVSAWTQIRYIHNQSAQQPAVPAPTVPPATAPPQTQPAAPVQVNRVSLTAPQAVGTNTDTVFRFTANPNFDASHMVIEFWSGSELRWSSAMNRTNSRSFFMNSRMTRNGITTVVARAYPASGGATVSTSMQVTVNPR